MHYYPAGSFSLTAPSTIDFGKRNKPQTSTDGSNYLPQTLSAAGSTANDGKLEVNNSVKYKNWSVQLSGNNVLSDSTQTIDNGIYYYVAGTPNQISTAPTTIYQPSTTDLENETVFDISKNWDLSTHAQRDTLLPSTSGLVIKTNQSVDLGTTYQSQLTWSLVNSI